MISASVIYLILQNHSAHHGHIISCQLRHSFSKTAVGQKPKKGRKQLTIRVFFWDNQVISFMKEWDEIQIQRVGRGRNPKAAIRSSGCDGCGNGEMSILFLRVADNRLMAYP